ncbi:MAG: thiol reductase thioredoxin [Sphingomonas bacterium]|nr:thiol reductase thioredoxin [Sphingomonas bacterium]
MNANIPIALALAAALLAVPAAAVPAPKVRIASIDQLPRPLPLPYVETADADAQIAAARARARKAGKKLLIDLGGNWCPDCRVLAGILHLPEVRAFVARHYEVVMVDVGRFDRNGQVAAHYGVKGRLPGVPAVLIVDPRTDRLLNAGRITALADARGMTPQALADWLAEWV